MIFIITSVLILSSSGIAEGRYDQEKGHPYPRLANYHWGGAPAEWYAKFDSLNGIFQGQEIKDINPETLIFAKRDWNVWEISESAPQEWFLRDSNGNKVDTGYGYFMDITEYCDEHQGKKYNRYIAEEAIKTSEDADGFFSQGLWEYPFGTDDVDLEKDGRNDWQQHGPGRDTARYGFLQPAFLEGIKKATEIIRDDFDTNGKMLIYNTGRFHDYEWENSNGLMLEHKNCNNNFGYLLGKYNEWKKVSLEPRMIQYNADRSDYANDYTYMRNHVGIASLIEGYVNIAEYDSGEHHYTRFYDEFELDIGWPSSEIYRIMDTDGPGEYDDKGVYLKFFDEGVAIVNIDYRDNTISDNDIRDLEGYNGPYYRFQGGQQPDLNNGNIFETVTLSGSGNADCPIGDALFLTKEPTTAITEIIIDDEDENTNPGSEKAVLRGEWIQETCNNIDDSWSQGCRDYRDQWKLAYTEPGTGKKAEYTPNIGYPGLYEIFEWHGDMTDEEESNNVIYTVMHAGGQVDVNVNQNQNHGQWNSLGEYSFEKGTGGKVIINAENGNGIIIADAVKFVFKGNFGNIKGEKNQPETCSEMEGAPCDEGESCKGGVFTYSSDHGNRCCIRGQCIENACDWKNIGLQGYNIWNVAEDPYNPGNLYAGGEDNSWISKDSGVTWNTIQNVRGGNFNFFDDVIIAGSSEGIYRSTDRETFERIALEDEFILFGKHIENSIYMGTGNFGARTGGLWYSDDKGNTWTEAGLQGLSVYAIENISENELILGVADEKIINDDEGIWISDNGIITQQSIHRLSSNGVWDLRNYDDHIYAATDDGVFRSSDEGDTWEDIGLSGKRVFEVMRAENGNIYAGSESYGFFVSPDEGNTWDDCNKGLKDRRVSRIIQKNDKSIIIATGNGIYESEIREVTVELNARKGWNIFFMNTITGTDKESLSAECGDITLFSLEGGVINNEEYIEAGKSYLLKTHNDCNVIMGTQDTDNKDIVIEPGWNVIGINRDTSYEYMISGCKDIIIFSLNEGEIKKIKEDDFLERGKAYFIRSDSGCVIS